ncbi:dihydrolipoyl dehydrogenase family protein [Nonomuraea dietziae]|uniref:dihydrolipoyl dehydrogenase family protein n=1 Tax=Nonomuraea dietziae TaxID=65515 RepID=UPI0033D8ED1B
MPGARCRRLCRTYYSEGRRSAAHLPVSTTGPDMTDVIVIGAGPAGAFAAHRAADLGARTTLVARDEFGGMAANDGPVPVRTLAHAARLLREAHQLDRYGITGDGFRLDYPRLLARVREVVHDVRTQSDLRDRVDGLGVTVHEHAGTASFVDPHTVETSGGLRLHGDKIILCTGGVSRPLTVPGAELTHTHSDAWALREVPPSMLVIGGGATGAQVASIFTAFGSRVELFEKGPRILPTEDDDVSAVVAEAFRERGMVVRENFDAIESFDKTSDGVLMHFTQNGAPASAEAALVVVAIGWTADTIGLNLAAAGVATDERGFVRVDAYQRTSVPHIFAAGDVTGRLMLVPQASQSGFIAATNAVRGPAVPMWDQVSPIGSFTDPEYAQVGLTETKARKEHDVIVATVGLDAATRPVIDGRTTGFCKLIVDRTSNQILGCHVVGERAVETTQLAAVAMTARMRVEELARIPLSFPTYAGIVGRAAYIATRRLERDAGRDLNEAS